ncbi:regulatory signaling modulator protein AmpE [Microbulbifer salipaludis]|uniref:Regulatory signaling modulator protein AmpE n=1 Tax=Microbulbifer salipaludis TaxID=187980 RepID=A0ABS3EA47_9GAMM|nr:regulatory signaling modulator protein AmpE [Microbulbifer salipaludis]MBN8432184.1 regulatory signaling modulator protein AmpE [Microbulbifer salipaludis]
MALLIVLLALGLVQIWGSGGPLQRDGWFSHWANFIYGRGVVQGKSGIGFGLLVLLPVLGTAIVLAVAEAMLGWLGVLLVSVPVLLYSFGRGNFNEALAGYLRAWYQGDIEEAKKAAEPLMEPADIVRAQSISSAQELHGMVFRAAAYRAFERLFAVLFWFLLLGIPGAMLYRLSHLAHTELSKASLSEEGGALAAGTADQGLAARWLWLIEWMPVRAIGFSLAIVGNFAGCYRAWRDHLTCKHSTTEEVLEYYLEGALGGIDSSECSAGAAVSEGQRLCGAEIEGMQALLSRALLMWVTLMALHGLFAS